MNKKWGIVGCGWLGLELAKSLINAGQEVIGTTSTPEKLKHLENLGIIACLLKQSDFNQNQKWLDDLDYLVLNIPPSAFGAAYGQSMLNIAEQVNNSCNVIFISSTSVYPNTNDTVDENTPATGGQRNGPAVRNAEKVLESELKDRLTILRMAGLVGGDRHPIKYMARRQVKGASQPVNLVHRKDCIGIIQMVVNKNYWGKKLNVCCSLHPSREEYYNRAADQLDLQPPSFFEGESAGKVVSNVASKEILGYEYIYDDPFDFPF